MDPEYTARIARLEVQVRGILEHLGIPDDSSGTNASAFGIPAEVFGTAAPVGYNASPAHGPAGQPPATSIPPEVMSALQRGRMIEAIKIYRGMTGMGMKEAKDAVEGMARDAGVRY